MNPLRNWRFALLVFARCVSVRASAACFFSHGEANAAELFGSDIAIDASNVLKSPRRQRQGQDVWRYDAQRYAKLDADARVSYALMYCASPSGHGGDWWTEMTGMTYSDRDMIGRRLHRVTGRDLTHLCQFVGIYSHDLAENVDSLVATNLKLPTVQAIPRASLLNTYIDPNLVFIQKSPFLAYGLGIGYGHTYWIDRALGKRDAPSTMTLDAYFQKEYTTLSCKERTHLAILILSTPAYDREREINLKNMLKGDASAICAEVKKLNADSFDKLYLFTGSEKAQILRNIADITGKLSNTRHKR